MNVLGVLRNVGGRMELQNYSLNLITLAEKLGFNVEKFSKITGPGTDHL
jgi:hypothetical protein